MNTLWLPVLAQIEPVNPVIPTCERALLDWFIACYGWNSPWRILVGRHGWFLDVRLVNIETGEDAERSICIPTVMRGWNERD